MRAHEGCAIICAPATECAALAPRLLQVGVRGRGTQQCFHYKISQRRAASRDSYICPHIFLVRETGAIFKTASSECKAGNIQAVPKRHSGNYHSIVPFSFASTGPKVEVPATGPTAASANCGSYFDVHRFVSFVQISSGQSPSSLHHRFGPHLFALEGMAVLAEKLGKQDDCRALQ